MLHTKALVCEVGHSQLEYDDLCRLAGSLVLRVIYNGLIVCFIVIPHWNMIFFHGI